jgi:hypothetical protein
MRQPIRASALLAVFIGVVMPASTARAQNRAGEPTISAMSLPGGLVAARKAVNDPGRSDAGQFFVDVIRRSFQTPVAVRGVRRETVLGPLLDHLDRAAKASLGPSTDRLALPLTADVWMRSILQPGAKTETLATDILRSPSASLMYCGLLALDDATRQWFAAHTDVLAEIAVRHAAQFFIAAPGLRIRDNVVQLPGGAGATAAWESAVGKRAGDPGAFIKAVVGRTEVALPYFLGSVAQLSPAQARFMLGGDVNDQARLTAIRRLVMAFDRVSTGWDATEKPFWRPTLDPTLLVSDLRTRDNGTPNVPGTSTFWSAIFSSDTGRETNDAVSTLVTGAPVEFPWLCEQIFTAAQTLTRPPYQLVLFASRQISELTLSNAREALVALRGAAQFPALAGTLERAHITRLSAYADAAQRARALSAIDDETRAQLALVQFEGALTVIARAAARGSLSPDRAADLVSSLSAINLDTQGEYAGKVVEWVSDAMLARGQGAAAATAADATESAAYPRDAELLALLSGPAGDRGPTVEWEGTRYRISFSSAEAFRLRHFLGESPLPYITAADTLVRTAKSLEAGALSRQALTKAAEAVVGAADATHCSDKDEWVTITVHDRCREAVMAIARAAKSGETKNAQRLAPRLRLLSDALLARGLFVLAYAAGFGQPDNAVISPSDAASRHNFGFDQPGMGRAGAWRWPASGADRVRDWHITGSMLGIDLALAQQALVRITNRPPSVRPSISDEDRIVLAESVVLMEPALLTPEDHAMIVRTLKRGRERVAGLQSAGDADALAQEIHMPAGRRTLFLWTAAESISRATASLSVSEIFAAGLDGAPVPLRLDAWGVSGAARLGCQCLQMPAPRPLDVFAGRWFSGVLATGFADMNLRIAELLDQLRMPGMLLAPVLASATWDFLMNVRISDFDDTSAWADFVAAIGVDRVEQYLALLTTDGPLVPFIEGSGSR